MGGQSVPVGLSPACIWLLAPLRGAHLPQRLRSGSANPPRGPLGNAGGEAPRLPSLRGSHCGSGDRPSNHGWALKSILWTEMPGSEALAQSRGLGKPPPHRSSPAWAPKQEGGVSAGRSAEDSSSFPCGSPGRLLHCPGPCSPGAEEEGPQTGSLGQGARQRGLPRTLRVPPRRDVCGRL